jgi:predicted DNA-binding protein
MRSATRSVKEDREEMVSVIVRMPAELRQRLRAVALRLGLTDNEAIRIAIAAFVEDKALHAAVREALSCNYRRRRRSGM